MPDLMSQALAPPSSALSERRSIRLGSLIAQGRWEGLAEGTISAEVCGAERFAACRDAWDELVGRAVHPNAFMDPAVILAADRHGYPMTVVLSWHERERERLELAGAWAFRRLPSAGPIPWPVLCTTINRLTYVGTPVLDRHVAERAFAAMLDAVAADPAQPNIILANDVYADGAALPAMTSVLEARRAPARILEHRCRARLDTGGDPDAFLAARSSSKARVETRRKWRRLADAGGRIVACDSAAAIRRAFEDFLEIEKSGWKGRKDAGGAAIGLEPQLEAFARTAIGWLSETGAIEVREILIEKRAVAVSMWLRSGRDAFSWKQAYDEGYRSLGVGALLTEDVTRTLLADPHLDRVDSGNRNDHGVHARLWPDRQHVVDLVLDARRGGSLAFRIAGGLETLVRAFKRQGRAIRDAARALRKRGASYCG